MIEVSMNTLIEQMESALSDIYSNGGKKPLGYNDVQSIKSQAASQVITLFGESLASAAWHYLWYEAHHVPLSQRVMPSKLFMKGSVYNP